MPCIPFRTESGATGIVCVRRSRSTRCACGSGLPADLLCDWKVPGGTCDRKVCADCTSSPAPEKDLCPDHAAEWKAMKR